MTMPEMGKILTLRDLSREVAFPRELFWEGSYNDYLRLAHEDPLVAQSAYQRMYHALLSHGQEKITRMGEELIDFYAFNDPLENGRDAIYGLEKTKMQIIAKLQAGAARLGQEKRFLLLHGPVGSSKSTFARILRKVLCAYTATDSGKLYTYSWHVEPDDEEGHNILGLMESKEHVHPCPVHEDPFVLLPITVRNEVAQRLNDRVASIYGGGTTVPREKRIEFEGGACPYCRYVFGRFLKREKGDWGKVFEKHIHVHRIVFSELDRIGIGSFRPKDEKNQDATELSGDINFRMLGQLGAESDPRAFNFDGEFQVSHRGFFYVEEVLKLDRAFLYDFLGATQEHVIKPKRFAEMSINAVLMGGTNNPEFEKVRGDETMEAFVDRTSRIDVPYLLRVRDEQRIYDRTYPTQPGTRHTLAPHSSRIASLWSVATRLNTNDAKVSALGKAKLYDGKIVPPFTEETVRQLMRAAPTEGMETAISPRYIQDMIGQALVEDPNIPCVTPFAILEHLHNGLSTHSMIRGNKEEYEGLLSEVRQEYDELIKGEVQAAIGADKKGLEELFELYVNNIVAYVNKEKFKDPVTREDRDPNERLMREVEETIGVSKDEKDTFRASIVQKMGTWARRSRTFNFETDERLLKGLKLKLFNDRKDWVNLGRLHTGVVDSETQGKIDIVRKRLIDDFDYCNYCAGLVLERAATIFSGTAKAEEKRR